MSRAIASARQRRAGITPDPPQMQQQQQQQQQQQMQQQGLTLPQVISVVDARLIKLEKFMNESQQPHRINEPTEIHPQRQMSQQIIDEFQSRFDMLAQELMTLKDIVLKLQSYTMDVNKLLLEDRDVLTAPNNGLFELQNFDENQELSNIEEDKLEL
uniref:Uncharacterized protein n=1 Tax=viral metagenome TaxID=1070528 RepID=A0A6C0HZA1_9ZZZZ